MDKKKVTRLGIGLVFVGLIFSFFFFFDTFIGISPEEQFEKRTKIEQPAQKRFNQLYQRKESSDEFVFMYQDGFWKFEESSEKLISYGNFLKLKGWIMPIFVYNNISTFPSIEKFDYSNYDYQQLASVVNDMFVGDNEQFLEKFTLYKNNSQSKKRTLTIENKDIVSYFSLGCLDDYDDEEKSSIKMLDPLCRKYLNNFLNTFYLYDYSKKTDQIQKLQTIYQKLSSVEKKIFCAGLHKNALFSHTVGEKYQHLFSACGSLDLLKYTMSEHFFSAKAILSDIEHVPEFVFYGDISDIFVILSLAQKVAHTSDILLIKKYMSAVDSLLLKLKEGKGMKGKKNIKIYYDVLVFFNEHILKKSLEKNLKENIQDVKMREDIPAMIKAIDVLNDQLKIFCVNGDTALGHNTTNLNSLSGGITVLAKVNNLVDNFSNFVLIESNYINSGAISLKKKIEMKGYFIVENVKNGLTSNINTVLEIDPESYQIIHVQMVHYDEIARDLNEILKNANYNFKEVYQYIKEKMGLVDDSLDIDDNARTLSGGFTLLGYDR